MVRYYIKSKRQNKNCITIFFELNFKHYCLENKIQKRKDKQGKFDAIVCFRKKNDYGIIGFSICNNMWVENGHVNVCWYCSFNEEIQNGYDTIELDNPKSFTTMCAVIVYNRIKYNGYYNVFFFCKLTYLPIEIYKRFSYTIFIFVYCSKRN